MPGSSTVYTVDNISPVLRYSQGWVEGDSNKDPQTSKYSNGTFTVTATSGATMDLTFNGTSILIAGAKRWNHGPYSVTLDGQTSNYNGFFGPGAFQEPIFQADSLTQGLHNLKLTNFPGSANESWLDVDFVQWTSTDLGANGDSTSSRIIEDNDSSFNYQPSGSWSTDLTGRPGFSSSNGHIATSRDAQMTLTFSGTAVQLIGSIGPNHGSYHAWVDGSSMGSFSANRTKYVAQQPIFIADNLGNGQHTLTISSQDENVVQNQVLGIDYAVISGISSTDNGKTSSSTSKAKIAGIAVGAVVAIALIIALFMLWRRRQIKRVLPSRTSAQPDAVIDSPSNLRSDASIDYSPHPYPYGYNEKNPEARPVTFQPPSKSHVSRMPQLFNGSVPTPNTHQDRLYIPGREQDFGPAPSTASHQPPNYKQALNEA